MLAWILQRWMSWSDDDGDIETVFGKDDLLTHAMIFWANNAIGTSIRTYANNNRYPWTPSHDRWPVVEAPTGITFVGYENPPGVTTEQRVRHFLDSDRPAWYNPRQPHRTRPRRPLHPVGDARRVGRGPPPHLPRPPLMVA